MADPKEGVTCKAGQIFAVYPVKEGMSGEAGPCAKKLTEKSGVEHTALCMEDMFDPEARIFCMVVNKSDWEKRGSPVPWFFAGKSPFGESREMRASEHAKLFLQKTGLEPGVDCVKVESKFSKEPVDVCVVVVPNQIGPK